MAPKKKRRSGSSSSWGDDPPGCEAQSDKDSDWSLESSEHEDAASDPGSDTSCDFPDMGSDDEGDGEDGDEGTKDPQSQLIDCCVTILLMRVLNARQFCILMYLAGRCGLRQLAKLGLPPSSPSHRFMRKVRRTLGVYTKTDLYAFDVPGRKKRGLGRTVNTMHVYNFHEQMKDDLADNPGMGTDLETAIASRSLPDCYFEHPVVREHGDSCPVYPIGIFADGLPYTQTDSIIGWWVINLLTDARYLVCTQRKRLVCRCGCRGWCTYFAIFTWLAWCMTAAAAGVMPLNRHDFKEWGGPDLERMVAAGVALGFRCALIYIKGDWAEYAGTFGLPTWTDRFRPCYKCNASVDDLYCLEGLSPICCGKFRENGPEDYWDACERCEHVFVLSALTHALLVSLLFYDKRKDGSKGMALRFHPDLAGMGLQTGWRLEPSDFLADIGEFGKISVFQFSVMFWAVGEDSLTRHRNPLIRRSLGVSILSLTVDTLHTLYLGVMNSFCMFVIWRCLLANVWSTGHTLEELVEKSVIVARSRLHAWHRRRHTAKPNEVLTVVHDFTQGMIGKKDDKKCKTKGHETWSLLLFLLDELHRKPAVPDQGRLLRAGRALEELVNTWKASEWRMTSNQIQQSFDAYNRFILMTDGIPDYATECFQPKRHLMAHLLREQGFFGCPVKYATWLDEALNKLLKGATRNVSQLSFDNTVLPGMRYLLVEVNAGRRLQHPDD